MPASSRCFVVSLMAPLFVGACSEEPPPPEPEPPEVTVVTLDTEPVTLTRALPGRTNAFRVAEVRPQVTGIVQERLFTEGAFVEAGEPLYQLDDATYRAAYNSARATLARAEATLKVARLNAERSEKLVATNAVSREQHENTMATMQQAQADVGVAEAQVASAAVELGYARITSPISGRIGKSAVTEGALVTADQAEPLARVQQFDPIYVDLTQSASEFLEFRRALEVGSVREAEDLPVTILLEDGRPHSEPGDLSFAEVSVDPSTGSFLLRVIVPNPDQMLMPGMYVRAIVSNAVLDNGLLVPQRGITRDPKGNASAMVVAEDGTVQPRRVDVSQTVGDQWLVREGLAAGDRVVVEGLQKIQPGMPVQATEAPPATVEGDVPEASGTNGEEGPPPEAVASDQPRQ